MEKIEFGIKVYDNFIEITPTAGMKDNSSYEVKLKGLKELGGKRTLNKTITVSTGIWPAYASLQSIQSLIESYDVPVPTILYHIREASKFVDYIKSRTYSATETIPFEVEQFVKYRAAHECVMRYYIDRSSEAGTKGALGDVQFDLSGKLTDITALLKLLKGYEDDWLLSIRGYKNEGRAKPVSAVRGGNIQNARTITDNPPTRTEI